MGHPVNSFKNMGQMASSLGKVVIMLKVLCYIDVGNQASNQGGGRDSYEQPEPDMDLEYGQDLFLETMKCQTNCICFHSDRLTQVQR